MRNEKFLSYERENELSHILLQKKKILNISISVFLLCGPVQNETLK